MRKTFGFLVLLSGLALLPGLTPRAEADHQYNRYDRYNRYNRHPYSHRLTAWEIVRRDPCRWDEYRDFARRHKNPNKRQRFIQRLAREGCEAGRRGYRYGSYDHWSDRYSYSR